jgi:hypothetical protein
MDPNEATGADSCFGAEFGGFRGISHRRSDPHLLSRGVSEDLLEHDCPRCRRPVRQAYYGPCAACRAELVERFTGQARQVEVPEYEPKVNVTANAVALRDD